jgi:hypothetical protein
MPELIKNNLDLNIKTRPLENMAAQGESLPAFTGKSEHEMNQSRRKKHRLARYQNNLSYPASSVVYRIGYPSVPFFLCRTRYPAKA